ncbi:hypothetical protein BDV26DRAFT_252264 [Aspergillus bertholletiae]|uniref:Uncharacterized protein n=1 Tax=Aspergillus bertholletiae TaxID=1226010 RepID=A0A5N7BM88_9EURO|nr:hypothetical protein BDV26DRAFT_252264 [Aspergillus bertholletiae]
MTTYLVTGVARGIGLEIVKVLSKPVRSREFCHPLLLASASVARSRSIIGRSSSSRKSGGIEPRRYRCDSISGAGESMSNTKANSEAAHNVTIGFLPLPRQGHRKRP